MDDENEDLLIFPANEQAADYPKPVRPDEIADEIAALEVGAS